MCIRPVCVEFLEFIANNNNKKIMGRPSIEDAFAEDLMPVLPPEGTGPGPPVTPDDQPLSGESAPPERAAGAPTGTLLTRRVRISEPPSGPAARPAVERREHPAREGRGSPRTGKFGSAVERGEHPDREARRSSRTG